MNKSQRKYIFAIVVGVTLALILLSGSASAGEKEYEISLTKGAYHVNRGEFDLAIMSLGKALELRPGDKTATLYLGIAYSRAGKYWKARVVLTDALKKDPADERTRYELAVVLYKLGKSEEAKGHFSEVAYGDGIDPLRAGSKRYLDFLYSPAREDKKFFLDLSTGFEYDSNVILEPSAPITTGARKADWAALFMLDATWKFFQRKGLSGQAGYQFYQSFYSSLDDFDIHQHNVDLFAAAEITKKIRADLDYYFSYSLVGGDLFSRIHHLEPALKIILTPDLVTELHYTHEFRDFSNSDTFPDNSIRSGDYDAAGITQYIRLSRRFTFYLDYTYDTASAEVDFWEYSGNNGLLGIALTLGSWKFYLNGSMSKLDYDGVFPGTATVRQDDVREISFYIVKNITDKISLHLSEYYVNYGSNISFFDYTRNIAGLRLEVKL